MNIKNNSLLKLPVKLQYLPAAQAYIAELARLVGFSTRDITFFNIAVAEAITNVIKHAFLPEEQAFFEIECEITTIEFKIIIRDKGLPFDPSRVKEFSVKKNLDGIEEKGLGFRLMKGSVDQLTFHNMGYGGKEVHLVKYIDQKHIDKYFKSSQLEAYELPEHIEKKERVKIPYHTILLDPKQAIEISQCAYRTYGYTYIMENIYYPDRLIEMTKSGELISAVAVSNENQEVMSHCALERFGRKKDIPELGMAFTKPKFRGQGCMTQLNELLKQEAFKLKLKGIFSKAVTTHPYSQKGLLRSGFKDSALLIGLSPPKTFEGMNAQRAQRESLVLCYKKLLPQKVTIFAPIHHKKMIEKIYKNVEVDATIQKLTNEQNKDSGMTQSDVEIEVKDNLNFANIYLSATGKEIAGEINQRVKELCQKKIESINLYIDLCDPNSVRSVPVFEELGFFFAGVFPNDQIQYLVLQYLNNVPINYETIECASEFGKVLKEYVRHCDPNQN